MEREAGKPTLIISHVISLEGEKSLIRKVI